jgi:iron(III) transport system permease protein
VIAVPIVALAIDTVMLRPGHLRLVELLAPLLDRRGEPPHRPGTGEPGILRNPQLMGALGTRCSSRSIVALVCGVLGMLIGYTVVRLRGSLISRLLDQLSFLALPDAEIALGSIFLALFAVSRGPIPSLYGTFWLLVIACVVSYLPYAVKAGTAP